MTILYANGSNLNACTNPNRSPRGLVRNASIADFVALRKNGQKLCELFSSLTVAQCRKLWSFK